MGFSLLICRLARSPSKGTFLWVADSTSSSNYISQERSLYTGVFEYELSFLTRLNPKFPPRGTFLWVTNSMVSENLSNCISNGVMIGKSIQLGIIVHPAFNSDTVEQSYSPRRNLSLGHRQYG